MDSVLEKEEALQAQISDKILTVPNLITFARLILIPCFLVLLFGFKREVAAIVVYAVAACTDWVDGLVARSTHQVSKLGKLMDPLVDRFLLATGVISVCILGRLPLWIVILLVGRDLIILIEGEVLMSICGYVPSVLYVGKFATAFLMFGFGFLMLGMPMVGGLGLFDISWLPGWGSQGTLFGVWLIYAGMLCSISAFISYQVRGISMCVEYRKREKPADAEAGE